MNQHTIPVGFAPAPGDGKQSWARLGELTLDSQGEVPFEYHIKRAIR